MSIPNTSYFTIKIPDDRTFVNGFISFSTGTNPFKGEITEVPSKVTLGVYNAAKDVSGNQVFKGQSGVVMLRFNMRADVGDAPWYALQVERTGAPSNGSNRDVKFMRIYQDADEDDLLDTGKDRHFSPKAKLTSDILDTRSAVCRRHVDVSSFPVQRIPVDGQQRTHTIPRSTSSITITARSQRLGDTTAAVSHSSGITFEKVMY